MVERWVDWRPATQADVVHAIREGIVEPLGFSEEGIRAMALHGLDRSVDCRAYTINGEAVAVVGVIAPSMVSEECHLWLTCLPAVLKYPKAFVRGARRYVAALPYRRVTCLCDPEFTATVNWVRWMGFTPIGKESIVGKEYDLYERGA